MRCSLHQDRQGTRRTEVTARPATQPDPARPGHSSAPMNLHPHRELRSRRTNRPRPPHLRQPGFFIPALSCPVHTPLFSHLIPPLFHNGSISCISLPLRHGLSHGTTDTDSLGHILLSPPFHNGSNFRNSLPLRHGLSHGPPAAGLLDRIAILFLFHNGSTSRDSLPLRHVFPTVPLLQPPCATFYFRPLSTTAAISAILCRCGTAFLAAPLLQAFWTALPSCYASTTAAFLAFLCRCGIDFLTDPCYRPSGRHCHPVTLRKVSL